MADKALTDIFSEGSVLLSAKPSHDAEELLYKAVYKYLVESVGAVVWVCYQHTSNEVEKRLASKKISFQNMVFIDMVSHMMGLQIEKHNTICCTSPTDYSCLFRYLDELFGKYGRCLVVIDNLNAMMSYDVLERLIKTFRNLNNIIPQRNSAVVYLEILGACDARTEITLQTTMNSVLKIDGDRVSVKNEKWEELKKVSWTDVFSLNAPVFFGIILVMAIVIILLLFIIVVLILKGGF